jgi:hypothetical protein
MDLISAHHSEALFAVALAEIAREMMEHRVQLADL